MTSRDFCYWLQGFFEIGRAHEPGNRAPALTERQTEMIRKHLALVFKHEIDPSMGPPEHQAALNEVHNQPPKPAPSPFDTPPAHPSGGIAFRC